MVTSMKEDKLQPSTNVYHPIITDKTFVFFATSKNTTWIIDICASEHLARDPSQLQSVLPSH